jgi:hypothetical protein
MTATVLSFRTGHVVAQGHVAILGEILTREGCRCAHCRAPGGAAVLYGTLRQREVYVLLDMLEAFDAISGEPVGRVPADTVPIGVSTRIVLDVAFLDHDHRNVGRRDRRPNVVAMCQQCARRHDDAALHRLWAR